MNDLPTYCLRGLKKASWVFYDQNVIATEAFIPDSRTVQGRADGGREVSINWEDDSEAENFTLADKRNALHGAARLATAQIFETSNTAVAVALPLTCERQRLTENEYHGNIVYAGNVNSRLEKMLAAALALKSKFVSPTLVPSE